MNFIERTTQFHFGGNKGGGGGTPTTTVSSTPPPPTSQSVEIQQAQRDAAKDAAKKRGWARTVLAGETGGFKGALASVGASEAKKTVLG